MPKKKVKKKMKRMKKILAMVMAMAMVLGMSLTAFAEGVTIKIVEKDGTDSKADLQYVQAIKADTEALTGWSFTTEAIAEAYMSAFEVSDAQQAIIMLAKNTDATAYEELSIAEGLVAATASQIDVALSNVVAIENVLSFMENGMKVTGAGIYVIKAVEAGFTYKNMAAYVGFGEVDGSYPVLQPAEITAKKSSNIITKENQGEAADNAVAVGDVVSFRVESHFPYIDANAAGKKYVIQDTLTGAEFDMSSVKVEIGGKDYTNMVMPTLLADAPEGKQILEIDLSGLIDNGNSLANETVVVTYSATVTAVSVNNTVEHDGTGITDAKPGETNLYTGSITITKYDADGTTPLAGAEFVVARAATGVVEDETDGFQANEGFEYATFDNDWKLTGWVNNIEGATHMTTGQDGKATVNGLDENTYAFIEVKAPEGYSINEEPATAELGYEGEKAEAVFTAATSMTDTRLNALPSTGGIGTTIFTIGGVAIMVVAAGLFFATRKKSSK